MNTMTATSGSTQTSHPVVYYDGVCGFCNATVNFLLTHDHSGRLRFAPLQGETASRELTPAEIRDLHSLVLTWNGRNYRRTAAVVRILWQLGMFWKLTAILLWLIPAPVRDLGYRITAANRYRIFGKLDACRLPRPEEQARFLP